MFNRSTYYSNRSAFVFLNIGIQLARFNVPLEHFSLFDSNGDLETYNQLSTSVQVIFDVIG